MANQTQLPVSYLQRKLGELLPQDGMFGKRTAYVVDNPQQYLPQPKTSRDRRLKRNNGVRVGWSIHKMGNRK